MGEKTHRADNELLPYIEAAEQAREPHPRTEVLAAVVAAVGIVVACFFVMHIVAP